MSSLLAAVLLLLLPGICVGQWRRWDDYGHRRQPWQHWLDAADKTPTPPPQCTGNKVPVPCGELNGTDVNRLCPMFESKRRLRLKARCSAEDERLGAVCACTTPNRVDTRRNCMPAKQCPTCAANEGYTYCGAQCEPSCAASSRTHILHCHRTRRCEPGCVCKQGYVRDTASGKCVTKDECPAPPPLECAGGKVHVRCGEMADADVNRRCPVYGDEYKYKPRCSSRDKERGGRCACRMPLWVDARGSCVPLDKCPKACDMATEVFRPCGNQCEGKCGEKWPRQCLLICAKPACACKWEYRRDKASGKCVTPDKCPGTAPESDARNPMNPWPRAIPISYSHV